MARQLILLNTLLMITHICRAPYPFRDQRVEDTASFGRGFLQGVVSEVERVARLKEYYGGFDPSIDSQLEDSFDPSHFSAADAQQRIYCTGSITNIAVPEAVIISGLDFNHLDALLLCAKPKYGGDPRIHIGGWCDDDGNGKHVVFDASDAARPNRNLDSLEAKFACLQHCSCSRSPRPGFPGELGQPHVKDYRVQTTPFRQTPITNLQEIMYRHENRFRSRYNHNGNGIAVEVTHKKELQAPRTNPLSATQTVAQYSRADIICSGHHFPSFLPAGWTAEDFKDNPRERPNLKKLCAAVFHGGNKNANVGGFCKPIPRAEWVDFLDIISGILQFSSKLIPEESFRSATPQHLNPTAIQYYCLAKCTCDSREQAKFKADKAVVDFDDVKYTIITSKGGLIVKWISPQGSGSYTFINPATWRQPPSLNTRVELLGSPFIEDLFAEGLSLNNVKKEQCGNPCQKPEDCYNPIGVPLQDQCRCRVSGTLPFSDPVAPPSYLAYCLTAAAIFSQGRPLDLLPRSLTSDTTRWGCLCNSTYASEACCESTTMIVWEDASKQIPFRSPSGKP